MALSNQAFVDKYYPWAEKINKEYGLKFSPYFWLGQWALESANGSNKWTTEGNNVSASNVTNGAKTPIYYSGSKQNYFRTMGEWYDHLVTKIFNLGGNSTYARAGFKDAKTIEEASRAVVAGGYVGNSDPNKSVYAQGIVNKANELIKTTTPPSGIKASPEETNNKLYSNTKTTTHGGRGGSYGDTETDTEETDPALNTFEDLEQYLTVKNILLYFVALTLLLLIIRYLNKNKKGSDNE